MVVPYHFSKPSSGDPSHNWTATHNEYDNGKMDGFFTADGNVALGYYESTDLPYYYSLLPSFALCGNYFCSILSETYPNRLGLYSGTCGGNTTNDINTGALNYPMILDLLALGGITWKNYNVKAPNNWTLLALFKNWVGDSRLNRPESEFYSDLTAGTLPQASFITTAPPYDEHPSANIQLGQNAQMSLITALMASSSWASTAFLLTYDEGGGFFEHVVPPTFDAYGAGIRVPTLIVSPYAIPNYIDGTLYEHASVLKFVETVFALPTLASINHKFDVRTPGRNNEAANGQKHGPPAPPRDRLTTIGDLTAAFDFTQDPSRHPLPAGIPIGNGWLAR